MRILPVGVAALLVEVASLDEVLALYAAITAHPLHGVVDVVPAARTVLVAFDPGATSAQHLTTQLEAVDTSAAAARTSTEVTVIGVRYDGPDLDEVGTLTGLGADGVVRAHTGQVWTVAFGGFAPGFGYLVGADTRLHVPRRTTPRTEVPAGSVGLAGEFSGVYPRASPGGWQLIGSTDTLLWDVERDPPALLRPGTRVRFEVAG